MGPFLSSPRKNASVPHLDITASLPLYEVTKSNANTPLSITLHATLEAQQLITFSSKDTVFNPGVASWDGKLEIVDISTQRIVYKARTDYLHSSPAPTWRNVKLFLDLSPNVPHEVEVKLHCIDALGTWGKLRNPRGTRSRARLVELGIERERVGQRLVEWVLWSLGRVWKVSRSSS